MHSAKALLNERPVDLRMKTVEETMYTVAEVEGRGPHHLQIDLA
jgi:hypothetical protein